MKTETEITKGNIIVPVLWVTVAATALIVAIARGFVDPDGWLMFTLGWLFWFSIKKTDNK